MGGCVPVGKKGGWWVVGGSVIAGWWRYLATADQLMDGPGCHDVFRFGWDVYGRNEDGEGVAKNASAVCRPSGASYCLTEVGGTVLMAAYL
jgi:hypothetical protein